MKHRAIPLISAGCIGIFLLIVSLGTVWQFLTLGFIPETPAQDLAKHAAAILNFRDAFLDGQYLPRMQLPPKKIPDIPVFQFYGSLSGYICLPFLMLGLDPIVSLALGVAFIRWIGSVAIFSIGRIVGANIWASNLAAIAYLLTPYIVSNFYGRVAIPEATAHGVIAVLFYGIIRLFHKIDYIGIFITVLAIVALSLAHPIFLLYGCAAGAIFSVFLLRRVFLVWIGCIFLVGMLVASFQWLPGLLYQSDFVGNFTGQNPYYQKHLTSFSGLFWFPRSLAQEWGGEETRLFLTGGILTIPVMLLLIFKVGNPLIRGCLASLLLMVFASYSPYDFWQSMPSSFWALQFPYRLLSFVALFTSIGICLVMKRLSMSQSIALVGLVLVQSAPILMQHPYSTPLEIARNEDALKDSFANQDYVSKSKLPLKLYAGDGWLLYYGSNVWNEESSSISKKQNIVDNYGSLLHENSFAVGNSAVSENTIRVRGELSKGDINQLAEIWIAYSNEPNVPLDGVREVSPGEFSVIFKRPNDDRFLTIQCSSKKDGRNQDCPPIKLSSIESLPNNGIIVEEEPNETSVLFIKGASIFLDGPVELWLASPASPDLPVSEKVSVGPGQFTTSLSIPGVKGGVYMLVASRYLIPAHNTPGNSDHRRLSISISSVKRLINGVANSDVAYSDVSMLERHGYKRVFVINESRQSELKTLENPLTKVELPMAYSRMVRVVQNGVELLAEPSDRGLINVLAHDVAVPFEASFHWPSFALLVSFAGLGALVVLAYITFRDNREDKQAQTTNGDKSCG